MRNHGMETDSAREGLTHSRCAFMPQPQGHKPNLSSLLVLYFALCLFLEVAVVFFFASYRREFGIFGFWPLDHGPDYLRLVRLYIVAGVSLHLLMQVLCVFEIARCYRNRRESFWPSVAMAWMLGALGMLVLIATSNNQRTRPNI
jgi:hypothetical protein